MENNEFIESSILAKKLAKSFTVNKPLVIGIDGSMDSGKTILSYCLGCKLKITVINIDTFLNKYQGSFINQIKYEELAGLIKGKIKSGKSIIIEGICLLKVLSRINVKQDMLVYVKRMSCNNGTWCEEQELSGNGQIDENSNSAGAQLMNEIIEYHNEFKPLSVADYYFLRMEEA